MKESLKTLFIWALKFINALVLLGTSSYLLFLSFKLKALTEYITTLL